MNTFYAREFGDVRDITTTLRRDIGFTKRESWRDAPALFDDHTLTIQGHPVMEDWEDDYMNMLATIVGSSGGTILEVGYGMGISARHIQRHPVEKHLIIEANRDVYDRLETFAQEAPQPVVPLFGFWEEQTKFLPDESISGILFDTYPLTEEDIHANHFPFFEEAYRLLAPGGVLTYYSDEMTDFSPWHRQLLQEAGFTAINKKLCPVSPPEDCKYWKSKTILAPIIRK